MKLKTSLIRTSGVAMLVAMASLPLAAQENEEVFGRELMTRTELKEHRDTMRNLNSDAERAQYRQKHHERMLERANKHGVELKNGMGQGSGKGMGAGQGKGPGQGMGAGQGKSASQGMGNGQGKGANQGMGAKDGSGNQKYKTQGGGNGNSRTQ